MAFYRVSGSDSLCFSPRLVLAATQRPSGSRAHFGTLPCIEWVSHCIQLSDQIGSVGCLSCLERLRRSWGKRQSQSKCAQCQHEDACSDSSDFWLQRHGKLRIGLSRQFWYYSACRPEGGRLSLSAPGLGPG